jgi:hypothetical protein
LNQKRLAEVLGISTNALSKSLRGLRVGGVPRYIKTMIMAWEIMTPEQRDQLEAQVRADEKGGGES